MSDFITMLIIALIILVSIVAGIGYASADEAPQEPPKVTDCTPYKGSPADEVRYKCHDMTGTMVVTILLCGQPYSFVATCPTGRTEAIKK